MGFSQILKEIEENDIGIYKFPELGGEDDEDVAAVSMKVCEMQCHLPLIVLMLREIFQGILPLFAEFLMFAG